MAATNVQAFPGDVTISSNLVVDTNTLFVDSVGNKVGIGSTTPGYALTVRKNTNTLLLESENGGTNADVNIDFKSYDSQDPVGARISAKDDSAFGSDILFSTRTGENGALTERMRIQGGGNVGIGTNAPNSSSLHVFKAAGASISVESSDSGSYGRLELGGPQGGFLDFKSPFSDDYDARLIYNVGQGPNGQLDIMGSNVAIDATTLFVDSVGNKVGIGTQTPISALDIVGGPNTGTTPALSIRGGIHTTSDLYVLNSYGVETGVGFGAKVIGMNIKNKVETDNTVEIRANTGGLTAAGAIYFGSDDRDQGVFGVLGADGAVGTTLTEKLTVRADGKVGIGTTTPRDKLHLYGSPMIQHQDHYAMVEATGWRKIGTWTAANTAARLKISFLGMNGYSAQSKAPGGETILYASCNNNNPTSVANASGIIHSHGAPVIDQVKFKHIGSTRTTFEIYAFIRSFPSMSMKVECNITSSFVKELVSGGAAVSDPGVDSATIGSAIFSHTFGNTGNVGIGTTGPLGKLQVQIADASAEGTTTWDNTKVLFGNMANANGQGLGFGVYTNSHASIISLAPGVAWRGLKYWGAYHNWHLGGEGTATMTLAENKLEVGGTIRVTTGTNDATGGEFSIDTNVGHIRRKINGNGVSLTSYDNFEFFVNATDGDAEDGTNALVIDNSGRFGFGTGSPADKIDVGAGGNIRLTNPAYKGVRLSNAIYFHEGGNANELSVPLGSIQAHDKYNNSGNFRAQLELRSQGGALVTLGQYGGVGIGTTNPGSVLDVRGSVSFTSPWIGNTTVNKAASTSASYFSLIPTNTVNGHVAYKVLIRYDPTTGGTYSPYSVAALTDWYPIGTNSNGPNYNGVKLLSTSHAPNGLDHSITVSGTMGLGFTVSGLRMQTASHFALGAFIARWYQIGTNT
jgi:hypothetical protein